MAGIEAAFRYQQKLYGTNVVHHTGRNRPPVVQVLIYPGLGGNIDEGSYVFHADAPMLQPPG